jgi:putative mRNA 3-end processing factor
MNLQTNNDLKILISDHVDWNDILNMIKNVEPSELWTLHGNGKHLKSYFKDQLTVKLLNYAD